MPHATHEDARRFAWADDAVDTDGFADAHDAPFAGTTTIVPALDDYWAVPPTDAWGGSMPVTHPQLLDALRIDEPSPWAVAIPQPHLYAAAPMIMQHAMQPSTYLRTERAPSAHAPTLMIRPPSWRDGMVGLLIGLVALALPVSGAIAWGMQEKPAPVAAVSAPVAAAPVATPVVQPVAAPSASDGMFPAASSQAPLGGGQAGGASRGGNGGGANGAGGAGGARGGGDEAGAPKRPMNGGIGGSGGGGGAPAGGPPSGAAARTPRSGTGTSQAQAQARAQAEAQARAQAQAQAQARAQAQAQAQAAALAQAQAAAANTGGGGGGTTAPQAQPAPASQPAAVTTPS